MPLGILEALSYGMPCLITEGTTLAKKVEQAAAGWGCETSADAIAAAMRKAVEEKNTLAEKSENARRMIEKEFTWEKIEEDTLGKYRSLINA